MPAELPGTLNYGKVVGRLVLAVGDAADVGSLPDPRPATGTVTLVPVTPITRETTAVPPATVIRAKVPCTISTSGELLDPQGAVGVWLVTGLYRVDYDINEKFVHSHDILVTLEHTEELPLDLTQAMPPGGPILDPSEYAALSARLDVLLPEVSWNGDILVVDGESSPPLTGPISTVPGPKPETHWDGDILVVEGEPSPPLTGPVSTTPGPKPDTYWDGDRLVVEGEFSPPLTGPVSTVPGPKPDTIWVNDTLVVEGEASPSLTGPQGLTRYLVESAGTYPARPIPLHVAVTFVGTANPDLLGLMLNGDSWINTAADAVIPYVKHYDGAGSPEGVVAAQIGSRYIDVNATAGAVEWVKMSGAGNTGWQVRTGDTGLRNISADLLAPFTGSLCFIRRVGSIVTLNFGLVQSSAAPQALAYALPPGFYFDLAWQTDLLWRSSTALGKVASQASSVYLTLPLTGLGYEGAVQRSTVAAWPTTLPGTPA